MFTIHLHHLKFFSFHGVYAEEKILGNEYEVNAEVTFNQTEKVTQLHQTINYATIYEIILQRMQIPAPLLETLAQEMVEIIYQADKRIQSIAIQIKKLHPPLTNCMGSVGVSFKKDF